MAKLNVSKKCPAIGALVTATAVQSNVDISVVWEDETAYTMQGGNIASTTSVGIARCIARQVSSSGLYGQDILSQTEVDHWLSFCLGPLSCESEFQNGISYLDQVLKPVTFLVGNSVTIADYCVFGSLNRNAHWLFMIEKGCDASTNVERWYKMMSLRSEVKSVLNALPAESKIIASAKANASIDKREESAGGKFVDLPGAEQGKVVVRFPPEASGYLHVGHAKAALLNFYYRQTFNGKLIMRFDDTNPAKEKEEYEDVILEDLKMLQVKYDHFSRTSDHFETILLYCEKLLKEEKAYVDDTDAETMKAEREAKTESKNRSNTVEKNLRLWDEMKKGSDKGVKCAVRAKIDMQSLNGCMRDPTIYRCKPEPHPATGNKYKVYPTYDFACPIVDSIEGVTHALRTTEYMDRDDQFFWFIEALELRKPHIWAYARLNLTNTVMSKRKLTWLVDEGISDGWDDPRMPTVRGVLRRGLTVEALKQFILAQGSSRSVVFMEWDKIWAFNKKVLDPVVPRHTTVDKTYRVAVNVSGAKLSSISAARHPKNPEIGEKRVWIGPQITIDGVDAEQLKEGENATFINWGNLMIKKVMKSGNKIISVDADDNTSNKDFKKTVKLTWLCDNDENSPFTPTIQIYYDHIISKNILDKDDDFKNFVNADSKYEVEMLGDPELKSLKKGEMVQIQRRGYFICDREYSGYDQSIGKSRPVVLLAIPDGTPNSYGPPVKTAPVQVKGKEANKTPAKGKGANSTSQKAVNSNNGDIGKLLDEIKEQGDKVRILKEAKADKDAVGEAVKILLAFKAKYKEISGNDWKPEMVAAKSGSKALTQTASGSASDLNTKITDQGDLVRKLKAEKASKPEVDSAVKILLQLKAEFKSVSGQDWKPGMALTGSKSPALASELNNKVIAQGDLVRKLKADKAAKAEIDAAVKLLLQLKDEFKTNTNLDWKPGMTLAAAKSSSPSPQNKEPAQLDAQIKRQGDIVRKLKVEKANKADIDTSVKVLLALKAEYKSATGIDWKLDMAVKTEPAKSVDVGFDGQLNDKIVAQGNIVRDLKTKKAEKAEIEEAVKILLSLKLDYKNATGEDWKLVGGAAKPRQDKKEKQKEKPKEKPSVPASGQTRLGLEAKKEEDLPEWYSQVLQKAEMLDYYDVSGCYILRPWSYAIWDFIKDFFDAEIKKLGVDNCYFPCFVSKAALEKEQNHIDDFSPEVAWVTKAGSSDLAEPIAIRPTSETVMYPAYARWIQSYRDLPLKLNQWNNIVRWEFKHPQPFLRTREFLWQEGHTAFATLKEAEEEVMIILNLYKKVFEELLAVPVVQGRKTEKEKFAGGDYTTTIEGYIGASGRAIQAGTSHHLGQNFSKMFDITFENPETGEKDFVYQNSWGITTRTIGCMVMVHSDNSGLVLPPRVAKIQVVIVPCGITVNLKKEDRDALYAACEDFRDRLLKVSVRVNADLRDNYSPGWKFNHWELKGVPIRVEIGPKDMKLSQYVLVRRDTGEKIFMKTSGLEDDIPALLHTIQSCLLAKARTEMTDHIRVVDNFDDFLKYLDQKCMLQTPFCGNEPCEDEIKELSKKDADLEPGAPSMGAKSLCIPFKQPAQIKPGMKCVKPGCTKAPKFYCMFGRSY